MNDISLLKEEIKEQEQEIFRLRNSMNRADNGVKERRLAILGRTVARLRSELAALERGRASA